MSDDHDAIYKIILLGNSGVGKTSFLELLTTNKIPQDSFMTIGVDFKVYMVSYNNYKIKLHIWDTAGQESFRAIISNYYRDAVGALIFFDFSDKKSFVDSSMWVKEFLQHRGEEGVKITLVGNKSELPHIVTDEMINVLIGELNDRGHSITYVSISVKENIGVPKAVDHLVSCIFKKWPIKKKTCVYPKGIRLNRDYSKSKCCAG